MAKAKRVSRKVEEADSRVLAMVVLAQRRARSWHRKKKGDESTKLLLDFLNALVKDCRLAAQGLERAVDERTGKIEFVPFGASKRGS